MIGQFPIKQIFLQGWPVLGLLLTCSVVSIGIILERWRKVRKAQFHRDQVLQKLETLLTERKEIQAAAYCESLGAPIGDVLQRVLEARRQTRAVSREELERAGGRLIRAQAIDLARHVTALGTIGSIAPFVGLFGTVIGIIRAFRSIAISGGGGAGVVAAGIAEALVATALGLFVAIPAVVFYNYFTRAIERATDDMQLCLEEVVDLLDRR